jgi:hypothetical protein
MPFEQPSLLVAERMGCSRLGSPAVCQLYYHLT